MSGKPTPEYNEFLGLVLPLSSKTVVFQQGILIHKNPQSLSLGFSLGLLDPLWKVRVSPKPSSLNRNKRQYENPQSLSLGFSLGQLDPLWKVRVSLKPSSLNRNKRQYENPQSLSLGFSLGQLGPLWKVRVSLKPSSLTRNLETVAFDSKPSPLNRNLAFDSKPSPLNRKRHLWIGLTRTPKSLTSGFSLGLLDPLWKVHWQNYLWIGSKLITRNPKAKGCFFGLLEAHGWQQFHLNLGFSEVTHETTWSQQLKINIFLVQTIACQLNQHQCIGIYWYYDYMSCIFHNVGCGNHKKPWCCVSWRFAPPSFQTIVSYHHSCAAVQHVNQRQHHQVVCQFARMVVH